MQDIESPIVRSLIDRKAEAEQKLAGTLDPTEQRQLQRQIRNDEARINSREAKADASAKLSECRSLLPPMEERRTKLKQAINMKTTELVDLQSQFQVEVSRQAEEVLESQISGVTSGASEGLTLDLQDAIRLCRAVIDAASSKLAEVESQIVIAKQNLKSAQSAWASATVDAAELQLMIAQLDFVPSLATYKAALRLSGRSYSSTHDIRLDDTAIDEARTKLLAEIGQ